MNYLEANLDDRTVLSLAGLTTGDAGSGSRVEVPPQGVNNQTYLLPERGLVVKVRPGGGSGPARTPCSHWPAYTCALLGYVPNGGVRSLVEVTGLLSRHGGVPVPEIVRYGEGTGPGGSDFTVGRILPGTSFDWDRHRMGPAGARQLGDHVGRVHAATRRSTGFGIFGGKPTEGVLWWEHFRASYLTLLEAVGSTSEVLRQHATEVRVPLGHALKALAPAEFPLICIDQNPTHYLGDEMGNLTGFVDVEGHLWGPAEWELSTILMWISDPAAFREGYEARLPWPSALEAVQAAYTCYTFMEWILCVRTMTDRPWEADPLEGELLKAAQTPCAA